jgi:hypothetical protein
MYLTKIDNYFNHRNQLEKAILDLLRLYDRQLVKPSQVATFQAEIKTRIELLNEQYKRCKPFKCSWSKPKGGASKNNDHTLELVPHSVAVFKMYNATKGEYFPVDYRKHTNQKEMLV